MIYQLPNGKAIYLTLEEFLDLTDADVQFLMSINAGNYITNPFFNSAIKKQKSEEVDEELEDFSSDCFTETDELNLNDSHIEDDYSDGFNIIDINSII